MEKAKQDKIFQELLLTFSEKTSQKNEKTEIDTTRQQVEKLRKSIQKLVEILQKHPNKENNAFILELKKIDQNNNAVLIQQTLKEIGGKLAEKREDVQFFRDIRPILPELGINLPPEIYFSSLKKWYQVRNFLSPLFRSTPKNKQETLKKESSENVIQKGYETIQRNQHIHIFLRKKYRKKAGEVFMNKTRKYYFYTLSREKTSFFVLQELVKSL